MRSRLALMWLVPSIAAISGSAHAQSAEAEAMFNEGDKLMAAGKLAEACSAFEASNNLDPRAGTLIRLGECREANHQLASAWTAYKDALARVKDPHKRDIATAKVSELEPKLSHLTIVVGAHKVDGLAITRDGKTVDPVMWDRSLPVDGGVYTVGASAPGYVEWKATITVPPERGDAQAAIPVLSPLPKPVTPTTTTTPSTKLEEPEGEDNAAPPSHGLTTRRKAAIGVAAVGAASLVTGIVLGITAKGKRDDAFKLCPDPATPCADAQKATDLTSSGHTLAIAADVTFGVAALGAIGAAVLWVTGKPETASRIAIAPNGISIVGRF